MLGSLQILEGMDTRIRPRVVRQPTPAHAEDDDDDLPALESVSNSSESDIDDAPDDNLERQHINAERLADATRTVSDPSRDEGGSPLFRTWVSPSSAPDASSRFSTVVGGREDRAGMIIDIGDEHETRRSDGGGEVEVQEERNIQEENAHEVENDNLEDTTEPPIETSEPPPFVTDGRGRVVWSNKTPESAVGTPVLATTGSAEPPADDNIAPRTFLGRMFDAFF